ncbi:hypothetical protein VM1G_02796 [Cytospora mali]|uniref:CENP-V/GFA domain-containing protein n=1 Tax=Cytospora mali TaxID=578113 RepID=A0A194VUI9_CYTMA|nr:hypothetical protein VM1G_02796 [Valsa mali]
MAPHYSDNPSGFPMEAGCCCGFVRLRLEKAPMAMHCCHCTSCQRETGSAFSPNIIIEASNVTRISPAAPTIPAYPGAPEVLPSAGPSLHDGWDDGTGLVKTHIPSESGEGQTVVRCPKCLAIVWSEYGSFGPTVRFIKGGTLDRAWLVEPDVHIFVRSKRPFVEISDGKPQFEGYYERAKVWRPESLERWAKLLPEFAKFRESLGDKH